MLALLQEAHRLSFSLSVLFGLSAMCFLRASEFFGSHAPFFNFEAVFVISGRERQALGVPRFSGEAAFLLNAKAALPRKWVSGGAPTLP